MLCRAQLFYIIVANQQDQVGKLSTTTVVDEDAKFKGIEVSAEAGFQIIEISTNLLETSSWRQSGQRERARKKKDTKRLNLDGQ